MKSLPMLLGFVLAVSVSVLLTSCPEDKNNASLPGSQWLLVTIDDETVESVEKIEFTSDEVKFYEDFGECWDYEVESYEIQGDSLIMNGGEYMVGFELDGDHLHIFTQGGEWFYTKDSFDATEFDFCEAVKRSANWKLLR